LITGSINDATYSKLKQSGIIIKWEAFGIVKDLVERTRSHADGLAQMAANESKGERLKFKRKPKSTASAVADNPSILQRDSKITRA